MSLCLHWSSPTRTGASGYVGGELLYTLLKAHPDYKISALVRDSGKAKIISEAYPNVRIVLGELESTPLIEEEAAKADIIVRKYR